MAYRGERRRIRRCSLREQRVEHLPNGSPSSRYGRFLLLEQTGRYPGRSLPPPRKGENDCAFFYHHRRIVFLNGQTEVERTQSCRARTAHQSRNHRSLRHGTLQRIRPCQSEFGCWQSDSVERLMDCYLCHPSRDSARHPQLQAL
jgi:hypothetical protein